MHSVCDAGNQLEELSEVEEEEKLQFHHNVENLRARYDDLLQTCENRSKQLATAAEETGKFLDDHLNPLLEWLNEVEVLVSPDQPVGGDAAAVESTKKQLEVIRFSSNETFVSLFLMSGYVHLFSTGNEKVFCKLGSWSTSVCLW